MTTLCNRQTAALPEESRGRVLIVHASADERSRVRSALATANCDIVEASDGTQAFMAVLASQIDLAITDLDMHPGSGFDFISALSILPVECMRPEVIVWSDHVGTRTVDAQLKHLRIAVKLARTCGLDRLVAAVDAVLDDPLQFVQHC